MKALLYTGLQNLELLDVPDPELKRGDALVRVCAAAVCGSDVHGWLGRSRGRVPPLIMGHELAGVIVEIRHSPAVLKLGDSVGIYPLYGCDQCSYCNSGREYLCRDRRVLGLHVPGGFAEYIAVPTKNLYPIPEEMGFVSAALAEPLANALHMVEKAKQDRGPIAVLGAGPIGLLALQVARQLNFSSIVVVEVNAQRSVLAQKLGARLAVNPKEAGYVERLEGFFGQDGCAAVFDAAGFAATRQLALKLVRSGGLIVLAGLGEADTSLDFVEMIRREIRIEASYAFSRSEFQAAIDWIARGRVDFGGWVTEAALAGGQAIFLELAQPNSTRIKVVLKP